MNKVGSKLEFARYPSLENVHLENILEQDKKVKEKLNLPQNCTIRYEKVKCCKDCKHNTHRYYYAYIWDCDSKKLKKKYIGKQLPPLTFVLDKLENMIDNLDPNDTRLQTIITKLKNEGILCIVPSARYIT